MRKTKRTSLLSLVLAVLMVVSVMPIGMIAASAATVTADANWYNTSDSTLYVDDAADLWAFATALNNGANFAGQTIKLTEDITVNAGWNAFATTVTQPDNVWPLRASNKKFAGTFDGQGFTISGIYMKASGEGVGIFGNIATGTVGAVRNVRILNSYVEGNGGGTGGIFGEVDNEIISAPITDETYVNRTKAVVDNVYAKINVVDTGSGNTNLGTGGILGGARTDVEITNTTFAGKVTGGVRGASAFVGAIRPYQTSYNGVAETNFYLNTITIKNCLADAEIRCSNGDAFTGAFVGYSNSNTTTHTLENAFSVCSVVEGTGTTKNYVGTLFGGSHTGAHSRRDSAVTDYQIWNLTNVHYFTVANNNGVFGKSSTGMTVNGIAYPHSTKAGVQEAIADTVKGSLQQSLTLKNDLTLNVYAMVLDPDAEVTINGEAVEGVSIPGGTCRFSLNGILPQQMNDVYRLRITQTVAGKTITVSKDISIRKYCTAFWEKNFATEEEKDLIADLLRYGAQAQLHADYNPTRLVTAGLDLTGYGSTVSAGAIVGKYNRTTSTTSGYGFLGASLNLDNSISLRLKFQAAATTNTKVLVSINGRTTTFAASDFASAGSKTYVVTFDHIGAHEMDAAITAKLMIGSSTVQTLTYSVADYCKAVLQASANGDEMLAKDQALIQKMYAYGLSAVAYNDANRKVIIDGLETDYVIVHDDSNETTKTLAYAFAADLYRKTGVMLPVVADTVANAAKEIIIGAADGRSETTTVYNQLTSYDKKGCRVSIVGNDIVVVSGTDVLLESAIERLLDSIRTHGGDTWGVELNYSAQIDLPSYTGSGTQKVYYTNELNHTLSVTGMSSSDYTAYVAKLKSNGFVEYTTNSINGNLFGTYIKTDDGSNMVAYTAYYPEGTGYVTGSEGSLSWTFDTVSNMNKITQSNCRITYGPLTFLPGTEEITASSTGVRATPSIMAPARMNAYMRSSGMCYVIQLLDGSFILLDGGNSDGKVVLGGDGADKDDSAYYTYQNGAWVKQNTPTSNDTKAIYDLLVEMSPDEKPVIAAWIMSHAHGDHINMSFTFMERYHDKVDVKMFAHNFPEATTGVNLGMNGTIAKYNTYIDTYYPDAERWIVHTGQKLYLPGCSIEIFFTPEDFYGIYDQVTFNGYSKGQMAFENGNETSLMYRITVGDTKFMVTGDSEIENCTLAGTRYQNALESDILQTPHHGLNGPELGFYEYVDPKIVLWSIDEHRMAVDARCLGYKNGSTGLGSGYLYYCGTTKYSKGYGPNALLTNSSYYANGWLQTSSWTRSDGTSGKRTLYGVSATKHTQIFCSYPNDFVIETTPMPLG